MAQITLRVPDELLEEIEDATGPETSRSQWLREAARLRLSEEDRLEDLSRRVSRLEELHETPLYLRLLR
jgi:metal-responsive CopG/Arc/MetJ family transcriptional regulator